MDKKKLGIIIPVFIIIAFILVMMSYDFFPNDNLEQFQISTQTNNEKIGLVINSPSSSISLQQFDQIFTDASSSGIGRSNVYYFGIN